MSASNDGFVYAVGDISGKAFGATRDIGAATYGSFNASLTVGRDVVGECNR